MATIGQNIRYFRTSKCMSQYDLASASGLHQTSIARFQLNQSIPSNLSLRKLSDALDVPVSALTQTAQPGANSSQHHLQPDEQRLLDLYRACDMQTRKMILASCEGFVLRSLKIEFSNADSNQ